MAVNTITIGAGTLTIGATGSLITMQSQVTACRLVPSVDRGDNVNVLSGEEVSGDRSESWNLAGTILQDIGAAESVVEWLFDHRGETHPFEFVPSTAKGRKFSGELNVEAVEMGGDVKTKPTSDFEFALVGFPTMGDAGAGTEGFALRTTEAASK